MEPGKPPGESDGVSEMKMILGGRFLEQRHTGTMMSQPFEGIGTTGYDNYRKKYVATPMDSAGTMILMMTGTTDKTGKVTTMTAQMDDFVMKESVTIESISRTVDGDHTTFELWGPGAGREAVQDDGDGLHAKGVGGGGPAAARFRPRRVGLARGADAAYARS